MPKRSMTPSAGTPWAGIALRDLIDDGFIEAPARLAAVYRGARYEAELRADGTILYDERSYKSPSTAAALVRLQVMGDRPGRPYPPTNGWTFWKVRRPSGEESSLDALRRAYFHKRHDRSK